MSNSKVDSDGFQLTSSKSKKKNTKIPSKDFKDHNPDVPINVEKAKKRIQAALEDIQSSEFFRGVVKGISKILAGRKVSEIVSFGLGHIGECNISRYQFALLLCLRDIFQPKSVCAHDPVFYIDECTVLKQLGVNVIKENTEGSYVISQQGVTIVYSPHCPQQLTNNFLWSNWGLVLQNCLLICNSFNTLYENQPIRVIAETISYIHRIHPHTTEIPIENNFQYSDIFNNTSIHAFPLEILESLESSFWQESEKPLYQNSEEFITSLMIEKLSTSNNGVN